MVVSRESFWAVKSVALASQVSTSSKAMVYNIYQSRSMTSTWKLGFLHRQQIQAGVILQLMEVLQMARVWGRVQTFQ